MSIGAGTMGPSNETDTDTDTETEVVAVYVYAGDVIVERGLRAFIDGCDRLVAVADPDRAAVAVIAIDRIDDQLSRLIDAVQRNGRPKIVAVVADVDDDALLVGASAGLSGVVRRRDGEALLLAAIESAARGDAAYPADLVGRLVSRLALERVPGPARRHAVPTPGLNEREMGVLRLLADGLDTGDIAERLCYSERTIKGIVHDVTTRFHLKNRSHAVAYAVRAGLI